MLESASLACVPRRTPMPEMALPMARAPRSGGGRISSSESATTSETLATMSPTMR